MRMEAGGLENPPPFGPRGILPQPIHTARDARWTSCRTFSTSRGRTARGGAETQRLEGESLNLEAAVGVGISQTLRWSQRHGPCCRPRALTRRQGCRTSARLWGREAAASCRWCMMGKRLEAASTSLPVHGSVALLPAREGVASAHSLKEWWRRGELNPRPWQAKPR